MLTDIDQGGLCGCSYG